MRRDEMEIDDELNNLREELKVTDRLLAEREKVLNAIPECPVPVHVLGFSTLTVVLERDTRHCDVNALIASIKMLTGVLSVKSNLSHRIDAQEQALQKIESSTNKEANCYGLSA